MIPKVGDIVRLTKEFVEYHKDKFGDSDSWRYKFDNHNMLILELGDKTVKFQRADSSDIIKYIRMFKGKFGDSGFGPIVFELVKSDNNHEEYCICNGPFVITGFTSSYRVCTQCHKEQK